MSAAQFALVLLVLGSALPAGGFQNSTAPSYSSASIVSSASNLPNDYAPNSIVSIYGANLAFATRGITGSGALPTTLDGVAVYIGNTPASLFYISPTQINVLVPYNRIAGPVTLAVARQGSAGPTTTIVLAETAPALFSSTPGMLLATHADGSFIARDSPAAASEVIIIYALGLGRTDPDLVGAQIPTRATSIQHLDTLRVLLNGVPADPRLVYYAGVTPGFAGLYQINLQLPADMPSSPEIRVAIGSQISASGLALATR